ncbi:MAG: hypothetical protein KDA55_09690 [Planctomycetales bacterium]|nr:hypothetical protein [Planctomycetales bacterium]
MMKRFGAILLLGVAFSIVGAQPAWAIKDFADVFAEKYVDNSGNDGLKSAAAETKCNVCHYGKSKKNRNDFGKALSKHITKGKASDLKKEDPAAAKAAIAEALEKALAEKKEGDKTFGDVLKAGMLPGTAPEGE